MIRGGLDLVRLDAETKEQLKSLALNAGEIAVIASNPIDLGVAGPYAVKGAVSPVPGLPNIYNPNITLGVIRNGVIEQNGITFVNPFEVLKAASHK